jgi:hypothetical protein
MYFTSIRSGSISLILTIYFALPCIGQVAQLDRYELVLEDQVGLDYPQVTSLGAEGILVHRRIRSKADDQVELIKLDTSLHEDWRGAIPIEKNLTISKVVARDQIVYALLRSASYGNFDFEIIAMDVNTRSYKRYLIKNLIPLSPTDFSISTNAILIGGYFNSSPVVLHFSFNTGRSRLLPGFFSDPGVLNQIKTDNDGLIDIIVSSRNIQRKKVLWIRSYTPEGDLIKATVVEGDVDKNLISGKSFRKADGTQIIAGSFGVRNIEYSRGIFIVEVKPDGEQMIQYYNFSDLENFFKFMKPRHEARLKERIEKRKLNGKKNRQSYRFLTNELHQYGNEFILLGEAFYPRYVYSSTYFFSLRGDRIFDGYRYTHAAIIGFDETGKLKWDNAFEINDIKTFYLNQFVKLAPKDNRMGMLYLFENEVRSKTIQNNHVLEGKSKEVLKSKFDTDMVKEKDTESSALEYWYHPYFYAHGIQYVHTSKEVKNGSGRKVLFINKLKYQ